MLYVALQVTEEPDTGNGWQVEDEFVGVYDSPDEFRAGLSKFSGDMPYDLQYQDEGDKILVFPDAEADIPVYVVIKTELNQTKG